ncbi:MAG: hypothetical protein WC982_05315 [Advenella sp.]
MKIADIIRAGIAAAKTNEQILSDVKAAHPQANTNAACINWYRSKAKKAETKGAKKAAAKVETQKTPIAAAIGHGWTVDKLKEFKGMEGSGYNADLYRDGVKVAEVIDDASGGPLMIQWLDKATETFDTVDYQGKPFARRCTKEEKLLLEYVATLPAYECHGMTLAHSDETFVDDLVNHGFIVKQVRSLVRGKVAFITAEGKVYTIKTALSSDVRARIELQHKGATILNDIDENAAAEMLKAAR